MPGENNMLSCCKNELSPVCENAAKGNIENGTAVYNTEKKVCANESNGFSFFLYNSKIMIANTMGIRIIKLLKGISPAEISVERI